MTTDYQWVHSVGEGAGEVCSSEVIYTESSAPGHGFCDDHDRRVKHVPRPVEEVPALHDENITVSISTQSGPNKYPYGRVELEEEGVVVLLYNNPDREHISVQIETSEPVNLRVMINDDDTFVGRVE